MRHYKRFFFVPKLLAGILLGVLIHILLVLGLPSWIGTSLFDQARANTPTNQFTVLPSLQTGDDNPHGLDPTLLQAICHGSVSQAPVLITANLPRTLWSVNIYNPSGTLASSTSHKTDDPEAIRLALLNPVQTNLYARQSITLNENVTVVELDGDDFFAVVRVWPPFQANRARYQSILSAASCRFLNL